MSKSAVYEPPVRGRFGSNDQYPPRFADLKKELSKGYEEAIIASWNEILSELETRAKVFKATGPNYIPQVDFAELQNLTVEEIEKIKRIGSLIIRNVVDDAEAIEYKEDLKAYVKANPHVDGFPKDNKQFFEMYWSKSQLRARSHPNFLALGTFLNDLYKADEDSIVDLKQNINYADRFRIRNPSKIPWVAHGPHIDGASIERWEDPILRTSFENILKGNWRQHDPFAITGRLAGNSDIYGRPNQSSVFRTWQGWLAMSDTSPGEGTLRVYPDLMLSSAYLVLRPFFRAINKSLSGEEYLAASNWEFDVSDPTFPGIAALDDGYGGQSLINGTHPHLRLGSAIVSMPRVKPGDMAFWHCDVIHSVEQQHDGPSDSSVMYIPAVPLTPQNARYLARQRDSFLARMPPPDFPQCIGEDEFIDKGLETDISGVEGRRAMGLEEFTEREGMSVGTKEAVKIGNAVLAEKV